jgi:hypothetical protein
MKFISLLLATVAIAAAVDTPASFDIENDNEGSDNQCRNKRQKRRRCEARGGEFSDCKCRIP